MEIEFLYFEGCPGQATARVLLDAVLAEEGIAAPVRVVKIDDDAGAARHRFRGSPTIRVDGHDLLEQLDAEYGLHCRVYWVDGRPQAYPSREMIRAAVRAARGRSDAGC